MVEPFRALRSWRSICALLSRDRVCLDLCLFLPDRFVENFYALTARLEPRRQKHHANVALVVASVGARGEEALNLCSAKIYGGIAALPYNATGLFVAAGNNVEGCGSVARYDGPRFFILAARRSQYDFLTNTHNFSKPAVWVRYAGVSGALLRVTVCGPDYGLQIVRTSSKTIRRCSFLVCVAFDFKTPGLCKSLDIVAQTGTTYYFGAGEGQDGSTWTIDVEQIASDAPFEAYVDPPFANTSIVATIAIGASVGGILMVGALVMLVIILRKYISWRSAMQRFSARARADVM